ncbi:MAG: hypothetical protein BWY17_00371 [Deltaproteobacteria bacterium ADurb.Bin207]|nr:MAG: hypothetical protein BWY17_00371 [Deltaproteobacteria bacterium ADurb.Bin207]
MDEHVTEDLRRRKSRDENKLAKRNHGSYVQYMPAPAFAPFAAAHITAPGSSLPLPALGHALPDGGLPRGAVVELSSHGSSLASSLALYACACAQQQTWLKSGQPAWCAWIDPGQSLYAPGVAAHGVVLERLLVAYPLPHTLPQTAVRMTLSQAFATLIIDTQGVVGFPLPLSLDRWPNIVRRLSLAARDGSTCVILLTQRSRSQHLGLPVALRLELKQPKPGVLHVEVAKERQGRMGACAELAWTHLSNPWCSQSA